MCFCLLVSKRKRNALLTQDSCSERKAALQREAALTYIYIYLYTCSDRERQRERERDRERESEREREGDNYIDMIYTYILCL